MLFSFIGSFLKKYIYSPHIHNWEFYTTYNNHIDVMGMVNDSTQPVFKCSCGKVKIVEKSE